MKNLPLILALLVLLATAAGAVVDPDTNRMSIYFDTDATIYELHVSPYQVVSAYVVLTRPDFPSLHGYEFSYEITGNQTVVEQIAYGPKPLLDVGTIGTVTQMLGVPYATTEATVLMEIQVFLLDANAVLFKLLGPENDTIPGWNGPLTWVESKPLAIQTTFLDPNGNEPGICAAINASDPQPTVEAAWGDVKSLYR